MNAYMVHRRDAGVGYSSLRRSTDNGATWDLICDLVAVYMEYPYFIHVSEDEQTIIVAGNYSVYGLVAKSVNGGLSFTTKLGGAVANHRIFCGCKSPDSETFWVGAYQGYIYKSTDNGDTWALVDTVAMGNYFIYGISFASDLIGWIAVTDGTIHKTTDGGANWVEQKDIGASKPFADILAVSTTQVWALERNNDLWKTTDGGTTWTGLTTARLYTGGRLYAIGTDKVWFTGRSGTNLELIRSIDGGDSFARVAVVDAGALGTELRIPVHFADENTGFIGFYHSWYTNDGGQTLQQGGVCVDVAADAGMGAIQAGVNLLLEIRSFDITGTEPADRTTEGTMIMAAEPLNFGTTAKGADSNVKCIIFRVASFSTYSTVSNMKFYLYDYAEFDDGASAFYADITDTWTQNKTPAQVKAGTPGVCPSSLPSANLTKIGGGDITGSLHADTSQYIYLVNTPGALEDTETKEFQYRVRFDYV